MPPSDTRKHDFIDALRGLAVLGVVMVHAAQAANPESAWLRKLMGSGAHGVQLFYVASALTLCMSWLARSPHESSPARNFYIRRLFRIAPMFSLAIVGYLWLYGMGPTYWAPNGIGWWFVAATATFLHGLHPETNNSVVPGGWSIAVEMSFYLVLPVLMRFMGHLKAWSGVFLLSLALYAANLLLVPQLWTYPPDQQYLTQHYVHMNFPGQLPVFVMGMLAFLALHQPLQRRVVLRVGGPVFLALFVLFWLQSFGIYPATWGGRPLKVPGNLLVGALFSVFAVLLWAWPARVLVNRATLLLGKLSFSLYLTHFAVLTLAQQLGISAWFAGSDGGSLVHYGGIVAAATAVSALCYRWVETPGIAWGKRLIQRLEARGPAAGRCAAHP